MTSSYLHCSGCGSWVVDREFVGCGSPCWFRRVGFVVLDRGSWIANSWAVLYGAGLWVAVADGVIWCWVTGARFGDEETGMRDRDERWAWYGAGLAVLCGAGLWVAVADGVIWCWVAGAGFNDGETEIRDRDERWETEEKESEMRDRDKRWEIEERESDKILLFFYNTCYSVILYLELHLAVLQKNLQYYCLAFSNVVGFGV